MPEKVLSTLEYEKVVERLVQRCYTERGRALVREKFGAETMTRELERLYQRLLTDKT